LTENQSTNKILHFRKDDTAGCTTSKWDNGVYVARKICGTDTYKIKNAKVDDHVHNAVWIVVDKYDKNGIPEVYTITFSNPLSEVLLDHRGHGTVR
jgi:hypothetical protein